MLAKSVIASFVIMLAGSTMAGAQEHVTSDAHEDVTFGDREKLTGIDPVRLITGKFDQYALVSIGEFHSSRDLHDLYIALVRDELFQGKVNDIVLEYGNSLYQDVLDRYVAGEDVPYADVQKVWRNLFVSQMVQYGVDSFAEFVKVVRAENLNLPEGGKMRVLAGGLPFDWEKPDLKNRYERFRKPQERPPHYADVVINEVLKKNRRALLISGAGHLKRHHPMPMLIEEAFPGSHFLVLAIMGFGDEDQTVLAGLTSPQNRPMAYELGSSWLGAVSAEPVENAGGNVRVKSLGGPKPDTDGDNPVSLDEDAENIVRIPLGGKDGDKVLRLPLGEGGEKAAGHVAKGEDSGRSLLDIADAILLIDVRRKAEAPESLWTDDAFWKELDRRNMAIYGRPLDPAIRKTKGASGGDHN